MANSSSENAESSIDYDGSPVVELEVSGTQYRVDPGFRGVVAVSAREAGTWSWSRVAEGRWDGVRLKAKDLDRTLVNTLEKALRSAAQDGM
ncbi:MAG TPA: hypothetical protein VMI54_28285 [Polyangiaceae bacterium]|nr:hypothetical protein [Polyangiaceae bacterium]